MQRYLAHAPKEEFPAGVGLVHNFFPGPHDDPGRDRKVNVQGFRVWITDEPSGSYGREHYGTWRWVDAEGVVHR